MSSSLHRRNVYLREDMDVNKRVNKIGLGGFSFIKGIAILVIIFGHISREFDMSQLTWFRPVFAVLGFLKTPFIPLFFIISGYGFKVNSVRKMLKKTIKALMVPYIFVMIGFCIFQPLVAYVRTQDWSYSVNAGITWGFAFLLGLPEPGKVILGYKLANCSIVWFILALFWAHNILNLILKKKQVVVQGILVVVCALLGYFLCVYEVTYFCIPQGLIATSYFYVGYLLKKHKMLERGLTHKWMYAAWAAIAALYASWGYFDLCYGEFKFFPVDYLAVNFLALLLLKIGIYVGECDGKILDIIKEVGIYSYWVICIHSVEQKCIPWKRLALFTAENQNIGFILALFMKAAIITICCMIIKRFEKWKYGKQKRYYERKKLCSKID